MQDNIITQEEIDLLTSPIDDTFLVEKTKLSSAELDKMEEDCENSPEFKDFFKKICNHSAFNKL